MHEVIDWVVHVLAYGDSVLHSEQARAAQEASEALLSEQLWPLRRSEGHSPPLFSAVRLHCGDSTTARRLGASLSVGIAFARDKASPNPSSVLHHVDSIM